MTTVNNARDLDVLVPMTQLLGALGFQVNECTRRAACVLHRGSNPTSFSWQEDGRWHCFACGAGGDRIALIRIVRSCSFREAMSFLALLAGVTYSPRIYSRLKPDQLRARRERATAAAWQVRDEILRLRRYYRDGLHRAERLWLTLSAELLGASTEAQREEVWDRMGRLSHVSTFFLAGFNALNQADCASLVHYANASNTERRAAILGG
jgi:hypothetical protein